MAKTKNKRKQQPPASGKKQFMRKLFKLSQICNAESAFFSLPKKDLEIIYTYRLRSVRVVAADDNIPKSLLRDVRVYIDLDLSREKIALFEGGPQMELKEFINVAEPFVAYLSGEIKGCKHGDKFRDKYTQLIDFVKENGVFQQRIISLIYIISIFISRINRAMYWMSHSINDENGCLFHCLHLHSVQAQKTHVVVNDISRLIYKVGWVFFSDGVRWLSVESRKVSSKKSGYDNLDVYMQSHAFHRLKERLDNDLLHTFIQENLYLSIERMEVVQNDCGRRMIAYYIFNKKLGYLPFDIVENKLIIRTFLFLTMDGTPEGDRVTGLIGIRAKDKEYLQIDRISAFLASDIMQNEEIYNIFINSGCGSLFELMLEQFSKEIKSVSTIKAYLHREVA